MPLKRLQNEQDILELTAYEEFAKRNAILHQIRILIGRDLKLNFETAFSPNINSLHALLTKQTIKCLEIQQRYEIVHDKILCQIKKEKKP